MRQKSSGMYWTFESFRLVKDVDGPDERKQNVSGKKKIIVP